MGDEDSRKIFVGGTRDADEGMLERYFGAYGAIESVKVVYDRDTNRYHAEYQYLLSKFKTLIF